MRPTQCSNTAPECPLRPPPPSADLIISMPPVAYVRRRLWRLHDVRVQPLPQAVVDLLLHGQERGFTLALLGLLLLDDRFGDNQWLGRCIGRKQGIKQGRQEDRKPSRQEAVLARKTGRQERQKAGTLGHTILADELSRHYQQLAQRTCVI